MESVGTPLLRVGSCSPTQNGIKQPICLSPHASRDLITTYACMPTNTHGTTLSMCDRGRYSLGFLPRPITFHSASYSFRGSRFSMSWMIVNFAVLRSRYEVT